MTVSSISLASSMYTNQQTYASNNFQQIRQEFSQLGSALQSQNLDGANTAYSALQQILSNAMAGNQTDTAQSGNGQGTLSTDFSALGQALQSGDVTKAQDAFTQLQQDMQAVHHHHHHHHHGDFNTQAASDATSDTASTTDDSSTTDAAGDSTAGVQTENGQNSDAQSVFSTDFSALGQALQSGDISQAQTAFETLQQDMQAVGQYHHHYASFYAQAVSDTTAASNAGLASDGADSVDISV